MGKAQFSGKLNLDFRVKKRLVEKKSLGLISMLYGDTKTVKTVQAI